MPLASTSAFPPPARNAAILAWTGAGAESLADARIRTETPFRFEV